MYVLITWKHSAKTMMHERATDQMIWMSFLANIWYISIKPVGLESFWTAAREQVTSGKESALGNHRFWVLWTSQHVPVKHSPVHELPHTFKHTRCKFAHHSQTERQHRKYAQVEGTVMSVDIKPLWANWILLSSLNYNWIWFSTFPNLIAKHKCRGTACSLYKKWGQPGTVGKTGSCAKQEAFDVFTPWLSARFPSFIFTSTLLPQNGNYFQEKERWRGAL